MNTRNPKIDGNSTSVQNLLSEMGRTPQEFTVVGSIQVPDWRGVLKHFQGIAPLNGAIAVTGQISASASTWWCASFVESGPAPAQVTNVFGTQAYDHAGGIQRLGDLLPIGLEKDALATVAFYDVSSTPSLLYEIHVPDKASAVAITNYTDSNGTEQAVLLVYRYDPKKFRIYRAEADSVGTNTWQFVGETNDLDSGDQFQCFGLVTQQNPGNDVVYLAGFREDEEVHLYSMDTGPINYGYLSHVTTYRGWTGSQWRYGVGLQIANSSKLRIFGCSEDPSGDRDDYTFPIYFWG